MGRPRKPLSAVSQDSLAGNARHYAARAVEPKTMGKLGGPSRWLSKECKAIWRRLARAAAAKLGENDWCLMEVTVTLKSKLESGVITGPQTSQLLNCLGKLGFIPASRQALAEKPAPGPPDEWENLDN